MTRVLPGAGAGDDHDGTVVRLDDRALLRGELLGGWGGGVGEVGTGRRAG